MELTVKIEEEGSGRVEEETVETEAGTEIGELLQSMEINPQTVLVERDGAVITQKDEVQEDDTELTILDVISGG